MVIPMLVYYTPAAQAQVQTPAAGGTTERPTAVAVLAFDNIAKRGGTLLGRSAAAAISQAMEDTDKWDPIPSGNVSRRISELGLTQPFDLTAMLQLGRALDADAIVTGTVWMAQVTKNQGFVGVRVEVRSVASGELINGAIAQGESGIRPNFSGDTQLLLDEALKKASFSAVTALDQQQLPHGTVLTSQATANNSVEALLNIGAAAGVKVGMEFIVLRGADRVGRVRVNHVEADQATADVVESTRGVMPEDKVQALFSLPAIPTVAENEQGEVVVKDAAKPAGTDRHKRTAAVRNALLALGGVLILALAFRKGSSSGAGPAGTVAQATGAFNGSGEAGPREAAARVSWGVPNIVRTADILGWEIYRSDDPTGLPVFNALPQERFWVDTERVHDLVDPTNGSTTGGGTTGNTSISPGFQTRTGVTGVTPGKPVTYRVVLIYQRTTPGGGGGAGTGTGGTGGGTTNATGPFRTSASTGQVTPYRPPQVGSPSNGAIIADLTKASFQFTLDSGGNTTALGPDQYVIQLSKSPTFTSALTMSPAFIDPSNRAGSVTTPTFDISKSFPSGTGAVYWRVGVKNSSDRPGPVGGWLFSDTTSFTTP
jgi:hypothetical protein